MLGFTFGIPSVNSVNNSVGDELIRFEDFFQEKTKTKVPLLNIITNHVIRRKGKQLRPMLVFLSAKLCGEINNSTYVAASLVELLHSATLIHNDVSDNSDDKRRFTGISSLMKNKIEVLVGDYFLSKGLLLAIDHKKYDLLELVSEAVKEISEAELMLAEKRRNMTLTVNDYIEIARKKTGKIISTCTLCGAKSVTTDVEKINALSDFGENLGIAMYIKNDMLKTEKKRSFFSWTSINGKDNFFNLPFIYALSQAEKTEQNYFRNLVTRLVPENNPAKEINNFISRKHGFEFAQDVYLDYKSTAITAVQNISTSNKTDKAIINLTNSIFKE